MDDFDLSVIRRTVHWYFSRNESPSLKKLLKQLKEDINFPYGKTNLYNLLKKVGFRYQRRGREGIVNERSDLITWRWSYLKPIKEVRENEPQREIVYTDETWLNAGHKVKKEWVDLKALENPRRSIKEFGAQKIMWEKNYNRRLHNRKWACPWCFVDIFSRWPKKKKVKKQEKLFEESAVNAEKARENENSVLEKNTDQPENVVSSSTLASMSSKKRKSKDESLSSASKRAETETDTIDLVKSCQSEGTGANEIQGIMEDFDYHESMNAENYEKYFEKVCSLLKPNNLIVMDNGSYLSRNSEDYPISKWRKAQSQKWLSENNISFSPDALRSEMWILCKRHRVEKTSKIVEEISKKYGHKVLRLPPYHCELNAIELIWGVEKIMWHAKTRA